MAMKKFKEKERMYGTTTMGSRGQLVIPAEARKEMGLHPGDRLVVMGKFGKIIALMKADEIENFIGMIMDNIDDREMRKTFVKRATALLKYSAKH